MSTIAWRSFRSSSAALVVGAVACTAFGQSEQTEQQQSQQTFNGMFGRTVESDYVAKHFSLIFGAVVLDPFNFTTPEPAPSATPAMPSNAGPAQAGPTPEATPLFLASGGDAKVRAFLEGGVRYRWAWLDRLGLGAIPRGQEMAHACPKTQDSLANAAAVLLEAKLKLEAAQARHGVLDEERSTLRERFAEEGLAKNAVAAEATRHKLSQIEDGAPALRTARADFAAAEARVKVLKEQARADTTRYYDRKWRMAQEGVPIDMACSRWIRRRDSIDHCGDPVYALAPKASGLEDGDWDLQWSFADCFTTGDFQARVGFVFDGGSPAGLSNLASSNNVYGDLIGGVNLMRASLPTMDADQTPIRATLNLEGLVSMTTDTESVDVHSRYLIGPAFVFGVPLWRVPERKEEEQGSGQGEGNGEGEGTDRKAGAANALSADDTPPAEDLKPGGIVELVARLGAVNVDVPRFVNSTSREVVVENGQADFSGEWGLGFDLELNVPITERTGYITARASINEFITPNPWGIQVGYTIPLSTMVGLATGGGGQ